MLREFVANKHTAYHQRFDSWEEAIQAGCEPLLRDNTITQDYVHSVIQCVKDYGPYIVIAPMIAMPHASTGAVGVNKTQIGFMKVEEPVHFTPGDSEKDAKLFFTLAAVDCDEHLVNMVKLAELLMNENLVAELMNVKSDDDLLEVASKHCSSK